MSKEFNFNNSPPPPSSSSSSSNKKKKNNNNNNNLKSKRNNNPKNNFPSSSSSSSNNNNNNNNNNNEDHLINFYYQKKIPPPKNISNEISSQKKKNNFKDNLKSFSSNSSSNQQRKKRSNAYNYFSSYKFIISNNSSLLTNHHECLYDPNFIIPWDEVQFVISLYNYPSIQTISFANNNPLVEEIYPCPICLDFPSLPVMTKCGHIYCVTCILRYLERDNTKKCPMCNIVISRYDLKDVLSPIHLPSSSITSSLSSTSNKSSNILDIGSIVNFSLLLCLNGSLVPYRISSLQNNNNSNTLNQNILTSLPSYKSIDMFYSRLSIATNQELLSLWNEKLTDIEIYRNQCLETIILQEQYIEEKNKVEKKTRGWETINTSNNIESSPLPLPQQQQQQQQQQSPLQLESSNSKITNEIVIEGVGDVEYLPLLPEAEELVRSKMKLLKKNTSNNNNNNNNNNKITSSLENGILNELRKQDVIYMYQLSAELLRDEDRGTGLSCPTFLHPLCIRCLLSETESSQLNEENTNQTQTISNNLNNQIENESNNNNNDNNNKVNDYDEDSIQTLFKFPYVVSGEILEVITETVNEASKKRYPFIRHLPLDTSYRIVEIDMRNVVRPETYEKYSKEFEVRHEKRLEREREKERIEKREKEKQEMEEQRIIWERKERYERQLQIEQAAIQSLLQSPPLTHYYQSQYESESNFESQDDQLNDQIDNLSINNNNNSNSNNNNKSYNEMESNPIPISSPLQQHSFASITKMGGKFPSLQDSAIKDSSIKSSTKQNPSVSCWGTPIKTTTISNNNNSNNNNNNNNNEEKSSNFESNESNKLSNRKTNKKKNQMVPFDLLSNHSQRSYR